MSHMLRDFSVDFQWLLIAVGASARHTCDMDELVSIIVDELKKRRLSDPRPLAARTAPPLEHYVKAEVTRSFDRVRLSQLNKLPNIPKATELRQLGKLLLGSEPLRDFLGVPKLQAEIWSRVEQEPKEGSDIFKYRCADEAFYLLETFTEKKPSNEAIQTIAGVLHGGDGANLERASKRVGQNRRKYPRNTPPEILPPLGTPFQKTRP